MKYSYACFDTGAWSPIVEDIILTVYYFKYFSCPISGITSSKILEGVV